MPQILPDSWRNTANRWLQACLPHSCLLCGSDSRNTLCPQCFDDLPRLLSACPQCAEPAPSGECCGRCLTHPRHFDSAQAPFVYAFPLDRLIHAYKYGGELVLAPWFARQLAEKLVPADFTTIFPMPLHPHRLRERGFNQAAELAIRLGKMLKRPVDLESLQRRRATPPQAALPHKERAANVRGAFECVRSLAGERILLIDDVMTTGATADEGARTLKLHGAATVCIAVVARAVKI